MRKLSLLLTVFCMIAANVGCAPEEKPVTPSGGGGANPPTTPEGGGTGNK